MRHPVAFDGQLVDAAFLNAVETDLEDAILARTLAAAADYGIVHGLEVTGPLPNNVTIAPGLAYDPAGERFEVPNITNVSFLGHGAGDYVYLGLLETDGTAVVDPLTGVSVYTRRTATWQVIFNGTLNPAYVVLAKITAVSGGGIATFDSSVRTVWKPRLRIESITDDRFVPAAASGVVMTHVQARGSGLLTATNPHAQTMEDVGFVADLSPIVHQSVDHAGGFEPASRAAQIILSDSDQSAVLTVQALLPGQEGDEISIELLVSGVSLELSVVVTDFLISITLATDELGSPISTAAEVAALLVADTDAKRLVTATIGQDGGGVVQEVDQTYLTGGLNLVDSDYGLVRVIAGRPDSIVLVEPVRGDSVLIDGNRLKTAFVPSAFTFDNQHEFAALYDVYVRSDGSSVLETRARLSTAQKATGLQIVSIDDGHPAGRFGLVLSAGTTPTIAWAGGPSVRLDLPARSFDGNKSYSLRSGLAGVPEIVIQVTFDQLPTDSQVDIVEVVTTARIASAAVNPRGLKTKRRPTSIPLAQLWWSGRATGRLGYGQYGQSGLAFDSRPQGNLRADQFERGLVEQLNRIVDETRANGFVQGGSIKPTGGLTVAVEASICWIDGRRVKTGAARLTLPASQTATVMVDNTGTIRFTTEDADNELFGEVFARIARITTDAQNVNHVQDERILLGEVDETRLLGHHLRTDLVAQQVPRLTVPQGAFGLVRNSVAARTLLLESDGPPGLYAMRIYLMTYGDDSLTTDECGVEIVVNAKWYPTYKGAVNVWVPDNPQFDSSRTTLQTSGFAVDRKVKAPNPQFAYWYDRPASTPSWDITPFSLNCRKRSLLFGVSELNMANGDVAGAQNPDFRTAVQNRLLPKLIVKAWGNLSVTGGMVATVETQSAFNMTDSADVETNLVFMTIASDVLTMTVDRLPTAPNGAGDLADAMIVASDSAGHVAGARVVKVSTHFEVHIDLYADIGTIEETFIVNFVVLAAQSD